MNNEFNKSTSDLIKKELLKDKYFTDKKMLNQKVYTDKMIFVTHDTERIAMNIIQRFEKTYNYKHEIIINIQSIETSFYRIGTRDFTCVKIDFVPKTALEMYLYFNEKNKKIKKDSDSTDDLINLLIFISILATIIILFLSSLCQ